MKAQTATPDSGISKAGRSSWSPAAGSAQDGHPTSGPRPPPSLLTDDGILGGERSAQPGARRPAQNQAQHTQQALQSRHRARRLPPPFKGTAGRAPWPAAAAAEAAAAAPDAVSRPRGGGRLGRRSAAGAYGKCSSGARGCLGAGAGCSGDADAPPAPSLGPQSAARDPMAAASARRPVRRKPQTSGWAWGGRKLPFPQFYGGDLSHS